MAAISDSDIVTAVRSTLPDALALTLFGSRAEGADLPGSDLDLAVLLPSPADVLRLWEAGEAIACILGVDVDLIDLRAASTVLQFQILGGRRLFSEGSEIDRYEMFILSEMMALNEARAPLIARIQKEGRVHGR